MLLSIRSEHRRIFFRSETEKKLTRWLFFVVFRWMKVNRTRAQFFFPAKVFRWQAFFCSSHWASSDSLTAHDIFPGFGKPATIFSDTFRWKKVKMLSDNRVGDFSGLVHDQNGHHLNGHDLDVDVEMGDREVWWWSLKGSKANQKSCAMIPLNDTIELEQWYSLCSKSIKTYKGSFLL